MLSPEKITRINELAQKKKTEGLTADEEKEQLALREVSVCFSFWDATPYRRDENR